MAEIRDDHIKCDKSDPWLKIRSPVELIAWTQEAAAYRGISMEELINEVLYDHFGKTKNGRGVLTTLHEHERKYRRRLAYYRYVRRTQKHKGGVRKSDFSEFLTSKKQVDWSKYEELRKANLKLLEAQEYEAKLVKKLRTTAELEALRVELESRGIIRAGIEVGGVNVFLRPTRSKKNPDGTKGRMETVGLQQTHKTKAVLPQVKGGVEARREFNNQLIEQVKEACKACGAEATLAKIEELRAKDEERRRIAALVPKNPTD